MSINTTATVVYEGNAKDNIIAGIRGTKYQIHLQPAQSIDAKHHTRVNGEIRAKVWKIDFVSKGGAYIEPIYGKPRRIQGVVTGALENENTLVIELWNTPILAELPERWTAQDIPQGTKVAIDIADTPRFQPLVSVS